MPLEACKSRNSKLTYMAQFTTSRSQDKAITESV